MPAATLDSIPLAEFAHRRARLLKTLKNAVSLLFAGDHDPHSDSPFRPHRHFEYLTGVTDEPGAIALLDPANPVEARRAMLFLKPLNPELEKWDGYRLEITGALRAKTGFQAIFRHDKLGLMLNEAARRCKRLAILHPPAMYTASISPDLEVFRKVAERVPGCVIEDRSDEVPQMRCVKSKNEVAMIRRACDITARGFAAALASLRPGMNEFDLQEVVEHAYRTAGARSLAFPSIAGSGVNSTVLHYRANAKPIEDGDMVCLDSGAKWAGYSADVTRTLPANGRFTPRQREVYEVVLKAQLAAIKAVKPGARNSQVDAAARKVITDAGFGDYFIHGIGHHLGLDTHDATPLGDQPLKVGAIMTIEPGIYIPHEKLGVRIEDDVLVTARGNDVLTRAIPKSIADIERAMARH
jgi:Xaa-Pro aminopeptidase